MHRVFHSALVAAIRDDRVLLGHEVEQIAARMWCEVFPARVTNSWHDLPDSSTDRRRMMRAARVALGGTWQRPVALVA